MKQPPPTPPTGGSSRARSSSRRAGRSWDRRAAWALCFALAIAGVLPFLSALVVGSPWARHWVARESQRLLREQGIVATYAPSLRLWPLAVELDDVRVEASDGGSPILLCKRLLVRPKLFALLSGKLAIDEVDLDEPHVRAVVRTGRLANLKLPESGPKPAGAPFHAPFAALSVTEASIAVDIDGAELRAASLDIDATAEDDRARGSTFDVALRVGFASVRRTSERPDGSSATDDDVFCSLDARIRVDPEAILFRRLEAVGFADLDPAPGSGPSCAAGADDVRRVELSLGHFRVGLPRGPDERPSVGGHVRLRAPVGLAARGATLPPLQGSLGLEADVRYAKDTAIPDVAGTVEGHAIALGQFSFAQELRSEIRLQHNVLESPTTTVRLAGGTVRLSDTVIDLLKAGGTLERTRLDGAGVDFTTLMRNLGVHPNSWVGWEIRELRASKISGTLSPLRLDGPFSAKTFGFGVYDRPAEDPSRERLFGFSEAELGGHLSIRPDAIKFVDVKARLPHSQIDGATVSLGFRNDLSVDAPKIRANLDDISPIGNVPVAGIVEVRAHIGGVFAHPEPEGDIITATDVTVADVRFGDLTAGHVIVDTTKPKVDFLRLHARRGASAYEVPTATLLFGGVSGLVVDAVGTSEGLGLRDLLSMFSLEDDPRFEEVDATVQTRADVHVALGGPEDACGDGYVALSAKGHLSHVSLFGEQFAKGDADMTLRWYDRRRGIAGADVLVRSFVLDKIERATGKRPGATGTMLGSASFQRGGAVAANVILENLPLSRVDALGSLARQVEGTVSGIAHLAGNLDDFEPNPGFETRAELDVTGVRARGMALPNSHLDVRMTQLLPVSKRSVGRTKCGAPISPPFDKAAYLADPSPRGEWAISGDLLGNTVHLRDVVITRARSPHVTGRASLRGFDVGALARIVSGRGSEADGAADHGPSVEGQIWGELIIDDLWVNDPPRSRMRLFLGPTLISRGSQKLRLKPPRDPIVFANDTVTMPPLAVTLDTADGFSGGFAVSGVVTTASSDPRLAIEARLDPVDLAILQRIVPKIASADGRIQGRVRISGKLMSPSIAGELHLAGDHLDVRGLPSGLTDIRVDVRASESEIAANGKAQFAGGSIAFDGSAPMRGYEIGTIESRLTIRGVRVAPIDGVAAMLDGDLSLAYDRKTRGSGGAPLPHIAGDLTLGSFEYSRPITFNLDLTSSRAKRTEVDAYDPALDFVTFDVALRSRAPILIKNNLIDVQLAIDSGTLEVTGTNQKMGLRGVLRALPGGRFHFQTNDFEVQTGVIRFDEAARIAPNVNITAVTEYRRYTDTTSSAGAGEGGGAASTGSTRGGSLWRITLHAFGDADNVHVEMVSEPALSQEDIALLLTVGMTRAELDQLQASGIGESVALNVLGAASGADRAVKQVVPIIDDFRFGSAYSTVTGKTEPQLTVGKRLTNDLRASVTAGLSEDRELRSNIEWRLNNRLSVQGSYDNLNAVSSSTLGNLGVDLRWRLEFE